MTPHNPDKIHNLNENQVQSRTLKGRRIDPRRETDSSQYIADMILELRNLANAADFKVLAELLEISYYEAFNCANKIVVPPGEEQLLHELGTDARKAVAAGV
jgi:hypothetical protein